MQSATPEFSKRYRFSDWPNADVAVVAAGVYAVWERDTLIYCGMSGREIERAVHGNRSRYGLGARLSSHATGRLSRDQFCVYVANRLIVPSLSPSQLPKFGTGELCLDQLTGAYIRGRLEYQFAMVSSSAEARELERLCRAGEIFGTRPLLNPS